MVKKFMNFLAAIVVIGGGATLLAQGGAKSGEGTLSLEDKNNTLSHALAYETTANGEDVIAVALTRAGDFKRGLQEIAGRGEKGRLR